MPGANRRLGAIWRLRAIGFARTIWLSRAIGFSRAIAICTVLNMTAAAHAQTGENAASAAVVAPAADAVHGPVTAWPRPVLIRTKPSGRDDVLFLTLGDVRTPVANGLFDPVHDRVQLSSGGVIENYFKNELKIPNYKPIDKSVHPVPPSGWCSWYYYYHEITPEEVLTNARWLREHLAAYGARVVQLDDGWQGAGRGVGENRDWTTINQRFAGMGLEALARQIRELGLIPGIWIAPHGQSNPAVVAASDAFLTNAEGKSPSDSWEGKFLLDPGAPASGTYLRDLFGKLHQWGYRYFKIDGQPVVLDELAKHIDLSRGVRLADETDAQFVERLYRASLAHIRAAIGPDSYLLGCWGIPLPGVGIMNGSRTGGDIVLGWDGFLIANDAVQRWGFLHNIAWYCDPDVLSVRPPLADGAARAWATLQGLSGQALLTSDRLMDLPAARVELLRRVYPAVDVRPLDLYRPETTRRSIWDLKVAHLGRSYDVVGVFNFDDKEAQNQWVPWGALGLNPEQVYHVYDFWQGAYLGAWESGVFIETPPADVRVLTLVPHSERPELISTSRHITQGWVDLLEYHAAKDEAAPRLSGTSRVLPGEAYKLVIGLPRGPQTWRVARVEVEPASAVRAAPLVQNGLGHARVTLHSAGDGASNVRWTIHFERAEAFGFPVEAPSAARARAIGLGAVELTWAELYHNRAGFEVILDGKPQGIALGNRAVLRDLRPGLMADFRVRTVWYDGTRSQKLLKLESKIERPESLWLSEIEPERSRQEWGKLRSDAAVSGTPLLVAGQGAVKGLGTHAESALMYRLYRAYHRFAARVGVDDGAKSPRANEVVFQVWGDGRQLWESPLMTFGMPPAPVDLEIRGVDELELRVLPGSDGNEHDHADWLDARVLFDVD